MKLKNKENEIHEEYKAEMKIGLAIAGGIFCISIGYVLYKYYIPKNTNSTSTKTIISTVENTLETDSTNSKTLEKIVYSNVQPFQRKLPQNHYASAKQKSLAAKNGIELVDGYTYVTGFERCTHYS